MIVVVSLVGFIGTDVISIITETSPHFCVEFFLMVLF